MYHSMCNDLKLNSDVKLVLSEKLAVFLFLTPFPGARLDVK